MDESLDAVAKEQTYVHTVYNEIASHFSQTRYKVCSNERLSRFKYN